MSYLNTSAVITTKDGIVREQSRIFSFAYPLDISERNLGDTSNSLTLPIVA